MNWQTVETLKANARHFHAGALAFILGHDSNMGVHVGMRSDAEHARRAFRDGWHSASKDYENTVNNATVTQLPSLAGPVQIGIHRVVFWSADKMSLATVRPTIWKGGMHGYIPR